MRKTIASRIKVSAVSLAMAVSAVSTCALSLTSTAVVDPVINISSQKTADTMKADTTIEGKLPADGAKKVTFTINSDYEGQSFSYGLGVSVKSAGDWLELDQSGKWMNPKVDNPEGTAIKLKKSWLSRDSFRNFCIICGSSGSGMENIYHLVYRK